LKKSVKPSCGKPWDILAKESKKELDLQIPNSKVYVKKFAQIRRIALII
jgi:hypothetical protein